MSGAPDKICGQMRIATDIWHGPLMLPVMNIIESDSTWNEMSDVAHLRLYLGHDPAVFSAAKKFKQFRTSIDRSLALTLLPWWLMHTSYMWPVLWHQGCKIR